MENTMRRVTKKDYFAGLRVVVENSTVEDKDELVAFIDKEVEMLERRNSTRAGKPTKKQIENEALVETIYNTLVNLGVASTITDIQAAEKALAELSGQKISALLKKLVDAKRVVKTYEKKKAYYLATVQE